MYVALYVRVSTSDQRTDNQLIRLQEVAKARGYQIIGEYIDTASGADARRPMLDKMLGDAKKHMFGRVLVTKIDRLARSVINLNQIMTDLETWGIAVEFIDQPIDTGTPAGKMTLTVLGAIAEFERELIRDRTRDGLNRARKEGKTLGRPKKDLSDYHREKIKQILEENPEISLRQLSEQIEGVSRNTIKKYLELEKNDNDNRAKEGFCGIVGIPDSRNSALFITRTICV